MVFSFFKKDPKDTKGSGDRSGARGPARPAQPQQKPVAGRPLPGAVNRSLNRPSNATGPNSGGGGFAVTENAMPDRERQRTLAMATAAKIDAIESEMARDFLRPRKGPGEAPSQPEIPRDAESLEAAPPPQEADEPPVPMLPPSSVQGARKVDPAQAEEDAFDPGSEILAGSIDAIEVNGSSSSVLDETAILFANRQDQAAEGGLRTALVAESLGAATERGWLLLLELLQQRGDRAAFDELATQFSMRFEVPSPAWINYSEGDVAKPAPAPAAAATTSMRSGVPVVQLPDVIDSGIVKPLEEFKNLATTHPALTLDVSAAREIDLVGAELLLRVFNAFKRASHELTLAGAEQLVGALRGAIEPGRRDASDAAWMLLLEVQRLLDRQADFEETGIQYCITYEVSPPSWEPPLANIRVGPGMSAPPPAAAAPARPLDPLDWRGEILGDGEQFLNRLVIASKDNKHLSVECRLLRRIAFSAATALLGQLIKLQQGGVTVEFKNVNSLIGALWQLLGVTSVADVRVRRA